MLNQEALVNFMNSKMSKLGYILALYTFQSLQLVKARAQDL